MRRFPVIRKQAGQQVAAQPLAQQPGPKHISELIAPLKVRLVGGPHHNKFVTLPRSMRTYRVARIETGDGITGSTALRKPRLVVDQYYRRTFYTAAGTAFEQFVHDSLFMASDQPLAECNSEGEFPLLGIKLPASQKLIRKEPYGSSEVHAPASRH